MKAGSRNQYQYISIQRGEFSMLFLSINYLLTKTYPSPWSNFC